MATTKGKPGYVAIVISDDNGSQILVKDGAEAEHFLIPIYKVTPEFCSDDLQFTARLQFSGETGISHRDGHWNPVGDIEVSKGKLIHLYIVTFLKDIVPPDGWRWCDFATFNKHSLNTDNEDPAVRESLVLAQSSIRSLLLLQVLGYIP